MKYLTRHMIVRYIVSGGTSAGVNLATLFVLNTLLHVYYITASILAFIIAFFVSLLLHKYWTFEDRRTEGVHIQAGMYLLSSLFGLLLNTIILYVCVEYIHTPVLVGQVIAGGLVACVTFFISRDIIFTNREKPTT
jgi:putative flippase GtrA